MSYEDDREFWTEFLQMYRERACLWNPKSRDYNNKGLRNRAYADLVRKCREKRPDANCGYVKRKLSSLRASFRRQFRKVQRSTPEEPVTPSLWYYDLMTFTVDQDAELHPGNLWEDTRNSDDEEDMSDGNASDVNSSTEVILPDTDPFPDTGRIRKRTAQEEDATHVKKKPHAAYVTPSPDCVVFGRSVGLELESISNCGQRDIAKKLISDVLFSAKRGILSFDSHIEATAPQGRMDHPTPHQNSEDRHSPIPQNMNSHQPRTQHRALQKSSSSNQCTGKDLDWRSYRDGPGAALRCTNEGTSKELLVPTEARQPEIMYYQQVIYPELIEVSELEDKRQYKCTWVNSKLEEEKELFLYPSKNGTVSDLLEEAKKQVELTENFSGRLRLLEIISYKIFAVLREDMSLTQMFGLGKKLRIEEIPPEDIEIAYDELLIPVAHFQNEVFSTFGVPFLLKVKDKEPFLQVKERIQKKLEVPDKEFEQYKFAIIIAGRQQPINDDMDYCVNLSDFLPHPQPGEVWSKPWLGLEHINKAPKRPRYNYLGNGELICM